jgi:hypothetical protein
MTLTPEQLIKEFTLAEDEVKDALNYARGHLILNDHAAALNSAVDAQMAMDRLVQLLEEG